MANIQERKTQSFTTNVKVTETNVRKSNYKGLVFQLVFSKSTFSRLLFLMLGNNRSTQFSLHMKAQAGNYKMKLSKFAICSSRNIMIQ